MMKKTPAWIAILFVLFLSGCSLSGSRENALFTYAKIESRKSEQLHTYDSPYTLYLKNADDTYTMFVFASPVQFSEGDGRYSLIDPTLVESSIRMPPAISHRGVSSPGEKSSGWVITAPI